MNKPIHFIQGRQFLKDALLWGFILWLIGYILGIILFAFVPANILGWVISPIGIIITLWVILKKVKGTSFKYYLGLSLVWTLLAVVLDYLLLVRIFKPADGYYKSDVYFYYAVIFILPLLVAGFKNISNKSVSKT